MKKQENKYIEDYVQTISAWDRQKLNDVLFQFTRELCDIKNSDFLKLWRRGNGRIPYALDVLLRDYLYSECLENKMPQLRWFYELYQNDRFGGILLFDFWLGVLAWGAHHFPEGCIITKEGMCNAIKQCKKIISEKEFDEKWKAEIHYFESLYQCYYKFKNDGRSKSFEEYCNEAHIDFQPIKAFYYI